MIQLVVLLTIAFLALASLRRVAATAPQMFAQAGRRFAGWLTVGVLIYLAATGRLAVVVAVVGALIAAVLRLAPVLVQFLPLIHRLWRQHARPGDATGTQQHDRTTTETAFLRMEIRHNTGEISGVVLRGRFAGRDLHTMTTDELALLHSECAQHDHDSAALLEAYLERVHGSDWRTRQRSSDPRAPSDSRMTSEEAHEILGLKPGATREAIIQAHRRLMQRLHPDRGGSDYLAAKINRAKDTLIGA